MVLILKNIFVHPCNFWNISSSLAARKQYKGITQKSAWPRENSVISSVCGCEAIQMARDTRMNTPYAKLQALIQFYALNFLIKLEIGHRLTICMVKSIIFDILLRFTKHYWWRPKLCWCRKNKIRKSLKDIFCQGLILNYFQYWHMDKFHCFSPLWYFVYVTSDHACK